jgi:hypothetical protein
VSARRAAVVSLNDYKDRLSGIDPSKFVGQLLWFSISGEVDRKENGKKQLTPVRVTRQWMADQFKKLQLDPKFLPDKLNPINAFKAVSTNARREYPLVEAGMTARLMVREVTTDGERIVRHVIREVCDSKGEMLSYDHIGTLVLWRKRKSATNTSSNHLDMIALNAADSLDREHLKALFDQIHTDYLDACVNLQSQAIRAILRNYLGSLNAIAVKPQGGVYFVHTTRQDAIDSLQTLVGRIGQGCKFHQLPLLDTIEQREMLTDAYQDEVEHDVQVLLERIAIANKAGGVRVSTYTLLNVELQNITNRAHEWAQLLGLAQGRAGAALELAFDSVAGLGTKLVAE